MANSWYLSNHRVSLSAGGAVSVADKCQGAPASTYASSTLCHSDLGSHWLWSPRILDSRGVGGAWLPSSGAQAQPGITFPWSLCQTQGWAHDTVRDNKILHRFLEKEITVYLQDLIWELARSEAAVAFLCLKGSPCQRKKPTDVEGGRAERWREGDPVLSPDHAISETNLSEESVTWHNHLSHFDSGFLPFATERVLGHKSSHYYSGLPCISRMSWVRNLRILFAKMQSLLWLNTLLFSCKTNVHKHIRTHIRAHVCACVVGLRCQMH